MELMKTKFKQTEVGLIPEDWLIKSIGEVSSVVGGGTPSTTIPHYWNGPIQWFTPSEISQRKYVDTSNRTITNEGLENSSARILPAGSILLTTRASIGETSILLIDATTNQGFQSLVVNSENSNEFLYYVLKTKKAELLKNASGSTFLEISPRKVKTIAIPLPPTLNEQRAIANALSDVDELIANLEKLIEKKKAIKQGAMQQLLTPRKNWSKKRIEEIADVGRGRVISHKEIDSSIDNSYPVYSSQTSNDGIMGYIGTFDFEGEYVTWTTDGVNAGTVFYRNGRFNCTNVCGTLKLKRDNAKFIAILLNGITPKYVSTNLANPKLMNDVMKKIEIFLPCDIQEQNQIAETLSLFELEILKLEKRYKKMLLLKTGMMQELLTGRTRLV